MRQHTTEADAHLNFNCVDYMGRNALHLAVDSENSETIELILDEVSWDAIEEALLHAISKGLLNIVRLVVEHPRYLTGEKQVNRIGKKDPFFRAEEKYQYPPDITPLILAAHKNEPRNDPALPVEGSHHRQAARHPLPVRRLQCQTKVRLLKEVQVEAQRLQGAVQPRVHGTVQP